MIVNTIVRVDQRPSHGTLEIPAGLVTTGAASCANNTIVWLGEGPYPAALPACFTVTTDREIWQKAVTEWIARHPPPTSQHRIIER